MKVLVAVKRVIDAYVKVRVKADGSGIEENKMAMNPFDEIAVEEAVRLKEKGIATEIIVTTIGNKACQETLRTALALGADSAIHIETEQSYSSLNIAKILHAVCEKHSPDLVIMGKQAIDGDNNQTGQMLAGLWGAAQGTFASMIDIQGKQVVVTREIDGGLETLALTLPAVITTDLRLNEPRYASLPNIMKAKRKPLDVLSLDTLGVSLKEHIQVLTITEPAIRPAGVKVDSVDALLDKLINEAKVLEGA